jgi:uncharacterized tellurite resistance protein B-like protein
MFDKLKDFMADLSGAPAARDFAPDDYRLAAASLLVHLVHADGVVNAAESRRLRELIAQNFALDAQATTRLIRTAEQSDKEAVDFYHFTNTLKRSLDDFGRMKIVEMMWEIAFADGTVTELEGNIVARIAELLSVSPHDRVRLRHEVSAERDRAPSDAGPWSGKLAEEQG